MHIPGGASLLFLVYVFVFLPWKAYTSAQRLRQARAAQKTGEGGTAAPAALPSREVIWAGTIISLGLLGILAAFVGRGFGFEVFALQRLGLREVGAAVLALVVCFAARAVVKASRSEEERRGLAVYKLVPRTPREWALSVVAILAAAVAEETAYRGVTMSILTYSLGNAWIAALLSAAAFAVAHWMQGWKSGLAIFAIGLAMQALVAYTGTLVLAMVVHALYDLAAVVLIARQLRADTSAPADEAAPTNSAA
jgi:membrane protease YdiL (CAAX protease family)